MAIMASGFFLESLTVTIDPDFDDEWGDCVLLTHEVATTGVIELHPNDNRLDYDPVPLHTRVYGDGTVAELKKREWKKHLEDLKQRAKEAEEAAVRFGPTLGVEMVKVEEPDEFGALRLTTPVAEPTPIRPPDPPPVDPDQLMIFHMRLGDPIKSRQGRIWQDLVMINESDLDYWRKDYARRQLPEVWRGRGYVIFKLR
jgi:hypothetical protein